MSEMELTHAVPLCNPNGDLNPPAVGWSRTPLHTCNLSGHPFRKKRWNYWCITTPDFLFSATLSNIDYMGLAFIYLLDFSTKEFIEQTVMAPFGRGCNLGDIVSEDVRFFHKDMELSFLHSDSKVNIQVNSNKFGGSTLSADFIVEYPPQHETLNVVIPWSKTRYQFTSKQNCLPASGKVQVNQNQFTCIPGESFACLDFGRGVWRYKSSWNWACFSTAHLGINLGGKWTDGTGYTENGITIDHILHKISDEVLFSYDPADFMKPWHIKTPMSQQVDLIFTPFFERIAKTDFVLLASEVHQMVGTFAGSVIDSFGKAHKIDQAIGWAEDHHARW